MPSLSLRGRSANQRSEFSNPATVVDQSPLRDEDVLQSIDEIYLKASEALEQEQHARVKLALETLVSYDAMFRQVILEQLSGFTDDATIFSEEKLNYVVMQQSYYNGFRTQLLVAIVNRLMDAYHKAGVLAKTDFGAAIQEYKRTREISDQYTRWLKGWHNHWPIKGEVADKIAEEFNDAFEEIQESGLRYLRRLMGTQLAFFQ